MSKVFVAALLLAASVAAIGQSKAGKDLSFKEAIEQARKNSKTTAGAAYDAAIATEFGQHYGHTMERCTSGSAPDLRTFEIVFQVAANGMLSHVMVSPETKTAVCVKNDLVGAIFAKPPQKDYWAHIYMELRAE